MTSERNPPTRAFVWIWLPGSRDPVPAGVIEVAGNTGEQAPVHTFAYGRSYLERNDAIPLGRGRCSVRARR
jgi:serine/threonine-protein kinase HipA